jgi:hypothetical protein
VKVPQEVAGPELKSLLEPIVMALIAPQDHHKQVLVLPMNYSENSIRKIAQSQNPTCLLRPSMQAYGAHRQGIQTAKQITGWPHIAIIRKGTSLPAASTPG